MAKNITFTANRINEDETTLIVFNIRVSSSLKTLQDVQGAISTALRQWVHSSKEAASHLKHVGSIINFGDLVLLDDSNGTDLCALLEVNGIFEIKHQTIFDTFCVDLDADLLI